MIAYNDIEKALPNEKLLALFRAVGEDCVFLRRECPLFV